MSATSISYFFAVCRLFSVLLCGLRQSTTYTVTVFVDSDTNLTDDSPGVSVVVTTRAAQGQTTTPGYIAFRARKKLVFFKSFRF